MNVKEKLGRILKKGIVKIYNLRDLKVSDLSECLKDSLKDDFEKVSPELLKSLKIPDVSSSLTYVLKFLMCLAKKAEETEVAKFYEMVMNIADNLNTDVNVNVKELLDEIRKVIDSFNPENWDGDPLSFPAVNIILSKIEDEKLTEFKIEILERFSKTFENYYDVKEEVSHKQTLQRHLDEMKALAEYKFLEDLKDEIGYIPPIKDYYQPNPCVERDTGSWETGPIRQSSEMNIVVKMILESENKVMLSEIDIENVVKIFLKSENKVLLLAADFGTGKTTASRILASKYAEDFEKVGSNYIPIFLKLTENSREDIESKLDKITMTKYQKTLLILDGLDEIKSEERDEIISLVAECRKNYPNIKIIITTRFGIYLDKSKGKFFRKLGLKHFYQLLPLTEELAENMLKKLGGLTLVEVIGLGISKQEYTKPIYLYLLWVLKKAGRLEKLSGYGKSGIYLALTNLVSRYKAKCVKDKDIKLEEKEELKARNVLIHIAVLRTMFESELLKEMSELEELNKEKIEELLSSDARKDLDEIGADFLITTYLRDPDNLTFIHKSFQEYLSAEFLLMSFLSGRYENLYTFPLTQEILEFLRGLAKMFEECIKSRDTEEVKELLKLVGREPEDLSIEGLIVKAKECLRGQYCIPFFEDIRCSGLSLRFCRFNDVENLIKLLVSGKIAVIEIGQAISENKMLKKLSEKDKSLIIGKILRHNYLPSLNLNGADLNGAKLILADLSGAKLNGADLNGAKLIEADLSGAKLILADLSGAKLNGVNWKGSELLELPSVKGANFENAKINDREFVEYLKKNGATNVPDPMDD